MARIEWENGVLVKPATVNVGGVNYEVDEAEYSGNTPLSAQNLNKMQDDIYEAMENIIESGNGYTKFPDGTLICTGSKVFSNVDIVTYGNSLYRSRGITFDNFAYPFIEVPTVSFSLKSITGALNGVLFNQAIYPTTTSPGGVCITKETNTKVSGEALYMAIGRWK